MTPDRPDPVTTEVTGVNVKISWTVPSSNGSPITSYNVVVLASDGITRVDDGVFCSSVVGLDCEIPMSTLTEPLPTGQFLLPLNRFI